MAPITKWSGTLRADSVLQVLVPALHTAAHGRPGPVHVDCPGDVAASTMTMMFDDAFFEFEERLPSAGGSVAARDTSGRGAQAAAARRTWRSRSGGCRRHSSAVRRASHPRDGHLQGQGSRARRSIDVVRRRLHERRHRATHPRRERSADRDRPRSGRADSARVDSGSSPSSPAVRGASKTRTCRLPSNTSPPSRNASS